MLEDDAFSGEAIKVWRKRTLGAEETHAVGAGRTEGDQDQVGFGCGRGKGEGNKDQTDAGHESSDHDSKCRGCAAIDQNLNTPVLTSMQLRVQSMYLLLGISSLMVMS